MGLAGALVLAVTVAAAQEGSLAAFQGQDYAGALDRLLAEAEDGSAEAKLGLGTLYDLGLGVARDPAKAFRWYLEAADEGLSEAQFNVAVMLDSGTGVPQDRTAAAIWYSRAALHGNVRAQYNLGILFEVGDGVDLNSALARVWLGEAAESLGAARERLDALEPVAAGPLTAPMPLAAAAIVADGRQQAELVWTAPGAEGDERFLVEIVALRASGGYEPVSETDTDRSAVLVDIPAGVPLLWRVSALADGSYAASSWQRLGDTEDALSASEGDGPLGRVRFDLPADDPAALVLAAELSASFRIAGLMMTPARLGGTPTDTTVRYDFASDADLAARIASALPGSVEARRSDLAESLPGLVEITLTGGPAAN